MIHQAEFYHYVTYSKRVKRMGSHAVMLLTTVCVSTLSWTASIRLKLDFGLQLESLIVLKVCQTAPYIEKFADCTFFRASEVVYREVSQSRTPARQDLLESVRFGIDSLSSIPFWTLQAGSSPVW